MDFCVSLRCKDGQQNSFNHFIILSEDESILTIQNSLIIRKLNTSDFCRQLISEFMLIINDKQRKQKQINLDL